MNAYYHNEHIAAIGTQEIYSSHSRTRRITLGDRLISLISFLVAIFTNATVVKIEKAVLSTTGFFVFFGVIGSMDCGKLGMLPGLFLCGLVALVEFLILRSIWAKR